MTQAPNAAPHLSRVLVVEDEAALRGLLEVSLQDLGGIASLTCATGAEALAQAPDFAPDLMVVDVQLTDGDGIALIAALHAHPALADVPAVVLTARPATAQNRIVGIDGIAGLLSKPFDPISLPATLTRLWLNWREEKR